MPFILKRILLVAAILLLSFVIAVLLVMIQQIPEPTPPEEVIPLVDVLDLAPSRIRFEVASQGTAQAAVQTQISAEVGGTIVSMSDKFVVGGAFKANETLLQIDPTLYRAALDQAEATLRQRQIEYDGIKRLDAKNYRSKVDMATAEAALATAQAGLVRAKNDLDKTRIRLPYDGIVQTRQADIGQFVSPGVALGSVFGSDRVEVRLPLGQNDLRFVELPEAGNDNPDLTVPVSLTGRYRGRQTQWQGRIVRTEATVDPNNRVTYAVAEVLDPYRRKADTAHAMPLPVGTFVGAGVPGRYIDNVLAIPRSAIGGNGQLVFVDSENQLQLRTVDIIRTDANMAYVDAQQVAERRLVVTTLEAPVNGQSVRIADDAQSPVSDEAAPPEPETEPGVQGGVPSTSSDAARDAE